MTNRVERLIAEVSRLPEGERAAVIEGVIRVAHPLVPEIEAAWAEEAEARLEAYSAGKIPARDLTEAIKHLQRS
jgi:hypothetical protein